MLKEVESLTEQSSSLDSGRISSVALVKKALAKAKENAHLNAFVSLDGENILSQAKASDSRRKLGQALSPVDGIPIAIKDNYLTKDYPTTACSNAAPLEPSNIDATIVKNLRNAGAIIFGKTNMDEWAFSPTNINSNIGATRNPHNPEHITCGSSGGSAAAVAAGIVSAAMGSDTGGSIRMPSAACGIYGFKPSYGRASRHGVLPLSWSLDAPGPLASSLDDIAMLLPYILGRDDKDVSTFRSRPFKKNACTKQINAVYLTGERLERSEEVDNVLRTKLNESLVSVVDAELSHVKNYYAAWEAIIFSEAASYHQKLLQVNAEGFSHRLRAKLEAGLQLTAVELLHAQKLRSRLMHTLMHDYGDWDVLVLPTLPVPAPKHSDEWLEFGGRKVNVPESMLWFCFLGNLTGFPCVTIPVAKSESGMPIGMMLMGRPGKDETLLSIAMELEKNIQGAN